MSYVGESGSYRNGRCQGIGRAIALSGGRSYVVVNYASSSQRAQEVVKEIQEKKAARRSAGSF